MEELIAITNRSEIHGKIYITNKSQFERMKLSDTYGQYGQKVDKGDAGDGITLISQKAVDIANKVSAEEEIETEYYLDEYLACYETDHEIIDAILELEEDVDYSYHASEVLAYNYHDGHNWRTIILESYDFQPEWEILENSNEIIKEYKEREWVSEGNGFINYESENFKFVASHWQGAWEHAFIDNQLIEEV